MNFIQLLFLCIRLLLIIIKNNIFSNIHFNDTKNDKEIYFSSATLLEPFEAELV